MFVVDVFGGRYELRGHLLFVYSAEESTVGTYHCVMVTADNRLVTGDAKLGRCVFTFTQSFISSHLHVNFSLYHRLTSVVCLLAVEDKISRPKVF